jgi:HD-GYP domain-containing protein (c-di-GMP phosphodiesterase class II)
MAVLRIKSGANVGKIYDLSADMVVLGREPGDGKAVQLSDQGISRKHAEIFRLGELYFIRDLESRNGTFVNDAPVSEVVLRIGDVIRIGSTVLVFEDRASQLRDSRKVVVEDGGEKVKTFSPSVTIQFPATKIAERRPPAALPTSPPEHRSLELLISISHAIAEEKDLSRILVRVAELIGRSMDADNVFIMGLRSAGTAESGDFDILARFDKSEEAEEAGVSRSIIRDCLEFHRSVLTTDAGLDARFSPMASVVMHRIKSVICVPITSLGKDIGVLYISNTHKAEAFSSEDLHLASAVGVELGITMQLLNMVHRSDQFFRGSIQTLVAASEMRDPAAKGRAQRLATYCMAMAKELSWDTHGIRNAWLAGMLHDIGSIPLTAEDLAAKFLADTKRNFYARELLKENPALSEVLPAIIDQNERWNGSGGAEGKKGDQITPLARVLGLAREFDQLLLHGGTNGKEMSVKEALLKVKDTADVLFDRGTVNALLIAYRNGRLFNQEAGFFETPTGV